MIVIIEDGRSESFTTALRNRIVFGAVVGHATGTALTINSAARARLLRSASSFGLPGVCVGLVGALFIMDAGATVGALIVTLIILCTVFIIFLRENLRWKQQVQAAGSAVPPPGTPVLVDSAGLWLGSAVFPWRSVSIQQIRLRKARKIWGYYGYYLDQLSLHTSSGEVVLDSALVESGQNIVEYVFGRAYRSF